jgi:hypothetical protein
MAGFELTLYGRIWVTPKGMFRNPPVIIAPPVLVKLGAW